ncbi:MAG: hypothetical protein NTX35_04230 [Verrucomicrobia bacterium]|nr:hypothetical protein [Verrucomicrobiota bacterium]
MNIYREFTLLIQALNTANVPYAVCGGMAMAVHGYPRATKDIDLLIHPDDLPRIEVLVKQAGFDVPGGTQTFKHGTPEETRVVQFSKLEDTEYLTLDLLLVTAVFESVWESRQKAVLSEMDFQVVSRDGLAKMKTLAGRTQDKADLEKLAEVGETPR